MQYIHKLSVKLLSFQLAAEYCIQLHEKNEENFADGLGGLNFVMQKLLKVTKRNLEDVVSQLNSIDISCFEVDRSL